MRPLFKIRTVIMGELFFAMAYSIVNASEKVIRFSRLRPEPGIQGEPRSTGTR
jgi:hypothetical protein